VPLFKGVGLQGDRLAVRIGYEGTEPPQIVKRPVSPHELRFAVAINAGQPQVAGGYYFNRALLGLLQDCLLEAGIHVVIDDIAAEPRAGAILPEEERGALQLFEDYALVTESCEKVGRMTTWHFDVGVSSSFYSNAIILDMILARDILPRLRLCLTRRCASLGVPLAEFPASDHPV